jgi:large subunit ribosomal protein L24
MNIKKGDSVIVIAGKDKGKKGKVLETSPKTSKLIVENINIVSRHKKPRSAQDKGGIIKQANPIERSNVMIVCSTCDKATRISNREVDGKKVRICKKCGASLDKAFVKAVKKEAKNIAKSEEKSTKTKAEKAVKVTNAVENAKTTETKTVKTEQKAVKTSSKAVKTVSKAVEKEEGKEKKVTLAKPKKAVSEKSTVENKPVNKVTKKK